MNGRILLLAMCVAGSAVAESPHAEKANQEGIHPDLVVGKRCITMRALNRTDPGLKQLGVFKLRTSKDISASKWSVGCECLDRDYADFAQYGKYVGLTGAKRARIFSGWAKTERKKGVYDFKWLDSIVRGLVGMGVKPWMCLSYGNPVYGSGSNIGTGVAGITGDPEAFAAWIRYCRAVVARYGDRIDEWEVWNEPFGPQMEAYSKLVIATSDAVREVQPKAVVMVSAVGGRENASRLLEFLTAAGRLDAVRYWHVHPYIPNPDAPNEWWGRDVVDAFRATLKAANPDYDVIQGETGCPSQLEFTHALSSRPWTEYSQVKWNLRSMAGYAARGLGYSVFAITDNQYKNSMLQSFGLLRANLARRVVYARPLFTACRNMFSFFDDEVKPCGGTVAADFRLVTARIPQVDLPSCDEMGQLPPDAPRVVTLARFEKAGSPVVLAWYSHRIPSDALVFDDVELTVKGATFAEPVWMDLVTGRVFEIPAGSFATAGGDSVFSRLPMWDSPVLVAERRSVPLK